MPIKTRMELDMRGKNKYNAGHEINPHGKGAACKP